LVLSVPVIRVHHTLWHLIPGENANRWRKELRPTIYKMYALYDSLQWTPIARQLLMDKFGPDISTIVMHYAKAIVDLKPAAVTEGIFRDLGAFGISSRFKQHVVKWFEYLEVTESKRIEYEAHLKFEILDLRKDDELDVHELTITLQQWYSRAEAERKATMMVQAITGDADKPITKDVWRSSMITKKLTTDRHVERLFKMLDEDGDGQISSVDLNHMIRNLADITFGTHEVDLGGDGVLNFDEFRKMMEFEPAYPVDSDKGAGNGTSLRSLRALRRQREKRRK